MIPRFSSNVKGGREEGRGWFHEENAADGAEVFHSYNNNKTIKLVESLKQKQSQRSGAFENIEG